MVMKPISSSNASLTRLAIVQICVDRTPPVNLDHVDDAEQVPSTGSGKARRPQLATGAPSQSC